MTIYIQFTTILKCVTIFLVDDVFAREFSKVITKVEGRKGRMFSKMR